VVRYKTDLPRILELPDESEKQRMHNVPLQKIQQMYFLFPKEIL
jgi:hypothetical protein